jgi:hypothetical protein
MCDLAVPSFQGANLFLTSYYSPSAGRLPDPMDSVSPLSCHGTLAADLRLPHLQMDDSVVTKVPRVMRVIRLLTMMMMMIQTFFLLA